MPHSALAFDLTGSTNMGAALVNAAQVLNADAQNRAEAEKVVVLLTDGIANEPEDPGGEPYALTQAERVKGLGYKVYTIGLGEGVNANFLQELATAPRIADEKFFYRAGSSKDLVGVYEQIAESICERGAAVIDVIPRVRDQVLEE